MLSHENNPPSPLKYIGKSTVQHNNSDENATGDKDLPEVDHLLISSPVDAHDFSIRDFVLAARSKDIGTNWPFSDKHLKLCLKHGVKDLLPPFQFKTSKIRKQSSIVFSDKNCVINDSIITRILEEPSTKADSLVVCSLGDVGLTQKIPADRLDVNFDISDKDSDFPSSVTSESRSYPSSLGGTFKPHKFAKTSAKLSAQKCRLIVKFSSPTVHSSIEGIVPQKTNLSDSSASKVCPVCKTFFSSSNTTLNAHIDQCLSIEGTSEAMADSKIGTKCKVNPRKMRSMVDIYATALECTIEDLDRRNGSNWATDLSMPNCSNRVSSGQGSKNQMSSPPEPDKDINVDGGVYIDGNGRKIRILSKMDGFSSVVSTKDDSGSRKPQIGKKRYLGPLQHNKIAISNKKFLPPKSNSSKILRRHESTNDILQDEPHLQTKGPTETDGPEISRAKGFDQYRGHKLHTVQESAFKSQKSRLGCFTVDSSSSQNLSRDSTCLIEKRKEKRSLVDSNISVKRCFGVERIGSSAPNYDKNYVKDTNGYKRLRKSGECVNESTRVGKNSSCKHLKKLNRSAKEIDENRLATAGSDEVTKHINQFKQNFTILHKYDSSSLSQLLVHEPQFLKKTLCLTNEEDRVQIEVEEEDEFDEDAYSGEDVTRWHSEGHVMHDTASESKIDESEQDRRGMSISSKEGALNMSANTCDEFVDNLGVPLSMGVVVEQERSNIRTDPCVNLTDDMTTGSFIRSMNFGAQNQEKADSYDYQSTSFQPSNDYSTGPSSALHPPNPTFNNGIHSYTIMDLDSDAPQGNRCDIDPIPIPGPPGSFLPSPGKAETVNYQGNSSLSASVKSSHEPGGDDSYESLNSAASSITNLAAGITEKVADKSASTGIPDSSLLGFRVPNSEVSMVSACKFPQSMKAGVSLNEYGQRKRILEPQEDGPLCCCSRKERVSQGSVGDQESHSQLLRRRIMSAAVLPHKENISFSLNTAPSYSCAGSDICSLSSSLSTQVEGNPRLGTPVHFSSPKYTDLTNVGKCHNNGDSESASPSAVLRLMGKNLMVAKNDEDLSGALGNAAPLKATSPRNLPYSQYRSTAPLDPAMISQNNGDASHRLDFRMSNGPWGQINFPRSDLTNYSQQMLAPLDHKWQQCIPSDQMHIGMPTTTDFRKHVRISVSEVGAMKSNVTSLEGTGVSVIHGQSRLIHPTYPGVQSSLSSTPICMQQGPKNTCYPLPLASHSATRPLMTYSQNGSYTLQGSPFATSSPSAHPKHGLFYSPRLS